MKYWVNVYHEGGVSIDDYPCNERYCDICGDRDYAYECETLEEACLFVIENYGEDILEKCGYKISRFEVEEITP
ncbi:TPA: hypothetical protein ACGO1T_001762 [Streptococcus suis]